MQAEYEACLTNPGQIKDKDSVLYRTITDVLKKSDDIFEHMLDYIDTLAACKKINNFYTSAAKKNIYFSN